MLSSIFKEFQEARSPLTLAELSQRLGIERSALEGMLQFLVRKGKIRQVGDGTVSCDMCRVRFACGYSPSGYLSGSCYELVSGG